MADRLADETLAQILDHILAVDDADFARCADCSPFGNRQWSSANTIFVCKRWMRVGTPTLYHTIILRSKPQAQSLVRALQKNRFGSYTRKLRLEGWFGTTLTKIFEASTKMTDICFQTSATSKDNVNSFCSSIGSVPARRIIIWNNEQSYTKHATRVRNAVDHWLRSSGDPVRLVVREATLMDNSFCSAVTASMVTHLDLYMPQHSYAYRIDEIFVALSTLLPRAHFRQLSLDYAGTSNIYFQDAEREFIDRVQDIITGLRLPSCRNKIRIRFRCCLPGATWSSLREHQARLAESSSVTISWDQAETGSSPMHGRPQALQVAIWAMILRRAIENICPFRSLYLVPYIQVSRVLRAAGSLVMPEDLHLWTDASVHNAIRSQLPVERVLSVSNCHFACQRSSVYSPRWFDFNDAFLSRWGTFSSLQTLRLHNFSCRDLPRLADTVGSVIRRLEISFDDSVVINTPQVLRFSELQRLFVICIYPNQLCGWTIPHLTWDLPQLEILEAGNINDGFLHSFTQSSLPRVLQFRFENIFRGHFVVPATFLSSHGAKLQTLVTHFDCAETALNKCPNLKTLAFLPFFDARPFSKITPRAPHIALREIKLPIHAVGVPHRARGSMTARRRVWRDLLDSFNSDEASFPALECIVMGRYSWPVEASQIKNSVEVLIAEELMERGLKVIDYNGDSWRPRLRIGGSTGVRKKKAVRPVAL